jgi:antitoxin component YwqK of YwqJK toxin-antitoxin module
MNKRFSILLFLILSNVLITKAQDKVNPNGYNAFHHPNGTVASEGTMKEGKPVGYWKSYYPDGVIRSEGNRIDNELDSLWKFYSPNGTLQKVIDYRQGKKSGYFMLYETFSDSISTRNVLISKELYIYDKLNGVSNYYDSLGNLSKTTTYENGRKHGFERYYAPDGRVTAILRYAHDNLLSSEQLNQLDKNGNKIGVWKEFYPDGQLKSFANYDVGKLDGYFREYSPTGMITKQNFYREGIVNKEVEAQLNKTADVVVKTREDGTLLSKGSLIDGKPVGIHREFDEKGNVISASEYDENGVLLGKGIMTNEGKRVGEWSFFYSDGTVKSKGKFTDNKRSGEWQFYFENGSKEQIGNYTNGLPEGKWNWFYPNGNARRSGFYLRGKEEGYFVEFGINQDTLSAGKYISGMKMDNWTEVVNDHTERGVYQANRKSGEWKNFYFGDKLEFVGSYVDGMPDGEHKYFYPNGIIKLEAKYSMGIPDGEWTKFDVFGVVETTWFYKSGELIRIDGLKVRED